MFFLSCIRHPSSPGTLTLRGSPRLPLVLFLVLVVMDNNYDGKPKGMFRVAGLNRLRAKELSAAEVKRGLRRNVTGGGQNIIPTMSFYTPKVWIMFTCMLVEGSAFAVITQLFQNGGGWQCCRSI